MVMATEEGLTRQKMVTQLKDLMSDAQLYGWDHARTVHGVWLNQLEQGHCTWMDVEKLTFPSPLVWHPESSSSSAPPLPGPWGGPVNAATSPPQSTTPLLGPAQRPARPTIPLDATNGGSTPRTSISAIFAFSP